jgi:hypothetical protein
MNTLSSKACVQPAVHGNPLIPLNEEARAAIPTSEAAFHLSRKTQTLRIWACKDNGPLRPIRVNGRLLWAVADLKKLLAGAL